MPMYHSWTAPKLISYFFQENKEVLEEQPEKYFKTHHTSNKVETLLLWGYAENYISYQEPFCPPRPSLPQENIIQSQYEQDLQQLHEVCLIPGYAR